MPVVYNYGDISSAIAVRGHLGLILDDSKPDGTESGPDQVTGNSVLCKNVFQVQSVFSNHYDWCTPMFEFIFFHQPICDTFTAFLESMNIKYQLEDDDDYINIAIAEDIDEGLIEKIENLYDQLLDESRDQVNSDEGENANNYQKASLLITLNNGDTTYAHVDSEVLNRVMQVISKDELNQLISAIADAVENQDDRSYCQIVKESGGVPPQL